MIEEKQAIFFRIITKPPLEFLTLTQTSLKASNLSLTFEMFTNIQWIHLIFLWNIKTTLQRKEWHHPPLNFIFLIYIKKKFNGGWCHSFLYATMAYQNPNKTNILYMIIRPFSPSLHLSMDMIDKAHHLFYSEKSLFKTHNHGLGWRRKS